MSDKQKKNKILVLGGFGFIGLNLFSYLKKKNDFIIVGRKNKFFNINTKKKHKLIYKDIFDYDNYINLIDSSFCVIFLAINSKKINKKKFQQLFYALKKKKIRKFILISSVSVYGNVKRLCSENSTPKPANIYGENCLKIEKLSSSIFNNKIEDFKILRVSNVFGVYRYKFSVIEKLVFNFTIKNYFAFSAANFLRSFISALDLSKVLEFFIEKRVESILYNVSNKNYKYRFRALLNCFSKYFNKNIKIKKNLVNILCDSNISTNKLGRLCDISLNNNIHKELHDITRFIIKNNFLYRKIFKII